MKILFIDNFDSFTYNLVDAFEKGGHQVLVYRNDIGLDVLKEVEARELPHLLVISPGPATPRRAGVCLEAVREFAPRLPIFGICLGHQVIIEAFEGKVGRAPEVVHGKASPIEHDGQGIFEGLPSPLTVGRYHSLVGLEIPECLEVSARAGSLVMAVRHRKFPVRGLQFHPESVLTSAGQVLIDRLLSLCRRR